MKHQPTDGTTLFDASTSEQARRVAQVKAGYRYRQICQSLAGGPNCIFEIAFELGCFDHQISGRFGELVPLGLIFKTGERRTKPATGCKADVYAIVGDIDFGDQADAGDTAADRTEWPSVGLVWPTRISWGGARSRFPRQLL